MSVTRLYRIACACGVVAVACGAPSARTGGAELTPVHVGGPAGGRPASVSSLPGAGSIGGLTSALGLDFPGQSASWETPALSTTREILGAGRLKLHVESTTGEAVLFAKVYDVSPDGDATLPNGRDRAGARRAVPCSRCARARRSDR